MARNVVIAALSLHLILTTQALDFLGFLRKPNESAPALSLVPASVPASVPSPVASAFGWPQSICNLFKSVWEPISTKVAVLGGLFLWIGYWLRTAFAEKDIDFLRSMLSSSNNNALKNLVKVKGPTVFRQDLNQSFHHITDDLEQSVLIWGEHKAGKSTFIQETMRAAVDRGRVVLYAVGKKNDTLKQILTRLFQWRSNAHWVRRFLRIPTRSTELPDIDPLQLTHLDKQRGLPLLVVDNINLLSTETISLLLLLAKEFVDQRIGLFVFVLSSGAKGKEFISFSPMSRVEKLFVGDVSESETLSYLTEVGRTEKEARQVFSLVGGRWEHLVKARINPFDFNVFGKACFNDIEGKVLKVSAVGWDKNDTLNFLLLFLEGSGQVESDVFVKKTDGTLEAVERMLDANLIQYRLDTSKYELHSELVKSYLVEKRKQSSL